MEHALYHFIYAIIWLAFLFLMSGCISAPDSSTPVTARGRVLRYLSSGRITIAVAALLCFVEFLTLVTGTKESARTAFGLPSDNAWAFFLYALLHADGRHLFDNVTWLLICGPLVERRMGPGWYALFLSLSAALGGYLLDTLSSFPNASPWEDGVRSVGFSIAGYALLALCIYWVAMCAWERAALRWTFAVAREWWADTPLGIPPNPLKWPLEAHQVLALVALVAVLLSAIGDGSQATVAGHRMGIMLGLVVAAYCMVRRYASRSGYIRRRSRGA